MGAFIFLLCVVLLVLWINRSNRFKKSSCDSNHSGYSFSVSEHWESLDNIQSIREELENLERLETDIEIFQTGNRQLGVRIEWMSMSGRKSHFDYLLDADNSQDLKKIIDSQKERLSTSLLKEVEKIR